MFQSTKSPHFSRRGKVGQLSKMKGVLCLSIYFMSLCNYTVCNLLRLRRRNAAGCACRGVSRAGAAGAPAHHHPGRLQQPVTRLRGLQARGSNLLRPKA